VLLYNPNLVVISGGPSSGKTTLLDELKTRGYSVAKEVARRIIQEQVQAGGTALPWRDREAYTRLMLRDSIASYLDHASLPGQVFFDRGIPDTLGYARLIELREDSAIREACNRYRYAARVFLCPPWEEIYTTDNERKQDFDEAVSTYHLLRTSYEECEYQVLEVPKATPGERAAFILGCVQDPS
jgi:predicted ATPase